jgi:hypothetical protein
VPTIPVNLGDVEAFEGLPEGQYLAEIDKIEFKEARESGKFPQLQVTYAVIDGEHLGRKQSEWVSLSPKAAFRLKKWFAKFGFEDLDNLDVNDDTNMLDDPDLVGTRVIFGVRKDGKQQDGVTDRIRTELVSVEDEVPGAQAPAATAPAPAAREPRQAARTPQRSLR